MNDTLRIDKFDNAPPEIREIYYRLYNEDWKESSAYWRSPEFLQFAKTWGWWWMQPPWSGDYSALDRSLMIVDLGIVS